MTGLGEATNLVDARLTPPQVAKAYQVDPATVRGWILAGELAAVDVARRGSKRPRFRISRAALAAFDKRRAVFVPPNPGNAPASDRPTS